METKAILTDRFQNVISSLAQCKIEYTREKDNCKRVQEINARLDVELKEARELEKSHRYHLLSAREMIGNLQNTVSELVYLKRDMKRMKEELSNKDFAVTKLEQEKQALLQRHDDNLAEMRATCEKQMEELSNVHERNMQQVQHECDTQVAQFTCLVEELRAKLKDSEAEHQDKMNVVVLEYEEKLQRSTAQITQLHDQHAGLVARTDANINAYRRRLEDLEEKLKQSQLKQCLPGEGTLPSQYESQVERPYSVNRDYPSCSIDLDPVLDIPKPKPTPTQNKPRTNTLQVNYYGPKSQNVDKKGPFNITKKRKLYNEKDFQDF